MGKGSKSSAKFFLVVLSGILHSSFLFLMPYPSLTLQTIVEGDHCCNTALHTLFSSIFSHDRNKEEEGKRTKNKKEFWCSSEMVLRCPAGSLFSILVLSFIFFFAFVC